MYSVLLDLFRNWIHALWIGTLFILVPFGFSQVISKWVFVPTFVLTTHPLDILSSINIQAPVSASQEEATRFPTIDATNRSSSTTKPNTLLVVVALMDRETHLESSKAQHQRVEQKSRSKRSLFASIRFFFFFFFFYFGKFEWKKSKCLRPLANRWPDFLFVLAQSTGKRKGGWRSISSMLQQFQRDIHPEDEKDQREIPSD